MLTDYKFKKLAKECLQVQLINYILIKIILFLQVTFKPFVPKVFQGLWYLLIPSLIM